MKIEKLIEEINNSEEYKKFLEYKEKMAKEGYNLDKKFAIFKDKKGDFHIVEIYINMGQCFMIESRNQQGENTRVLDEILDFQLGEEIPSTIIVKDVIQKQQYPFKVIDGVLVNKNALEREIDIEEER